MSDITLKASTLALDAATLAGDTTFRVITDPSGSPVSENTTADDIAAFAAASLLADTTALGSAGTLDGAEVVRVIDDPGGTPAQAKTTISAILTYVKSAFGSFANTALKALDTNASHSLIFKPNTDLAADRTLNFNMPDADANLDLAAWTAWTPTVAPNAGSITAYTATGRYARIGKTVHFVIYIVITTKGTGSGWVKVTNWPVAIRVTGPHYSTPAGFNASQGYLCAAFSALTDQMNVFKYDGTYPITADGDVLAFSGTYEAA